MCYTHARMQTTRRFHFSTLGLALTLGYSDAAAPRYQLTEHDRQRALSGRVILIWDSLGEVDSQGVTEEHKRDELKKFLASLPSDRRIILLSERSIEPEKAESSRIHEMGWDNTFALSMAALFQTLQGLQPPGNTQASLARGLNLAMFYRAYLMSEVIKTIHSGNPDALIVVTASLIGATEIVEARLSESGTPYVSIAGGPYRKEFKPLVHQLRDELGLEMADEFLAHIDPPLIELFRDRAQTIADGREGQSAALQRDAQSFLTHCDGCECLLIRLKQIGTVF